MSESTHNMKTNPEATMTDLPDAYRGKAYVFPADQLVVAAADYDALQAELAARNDELGRYMMANNRLAQELEAMRKVLMELVELKDLHDKIEASEFTVTKARQQQEYEKRKPLAWKAARAAIDREKASQKVEGPSKYEYEWDNLDSYGPSA